MHVKVSMKAVPRRTLSEHELKRCRALAKGHAWQVIEEDILWWSLDRQSWLPVDDAMWPERRRWLMVETEEGILPLSIWQANEGLGLEFGEGHRADPELGHDAPREDTARIA